MAAKTKSQPELEKLEFTSPDTSGYRPDFAMVGSQFKHIEKGHLYTVSGFIHNGDTNVWNVRVTRKGSAVPSCLSLDTLLNVGLFKRIN